MKYSIVLTTLVAYAAMSAQVYAQDPGYNYPIISTGVSYETPRVANIRLGGGISHFLDCEKGDLICGLARLNHFYEFQYDPVNTTIGFSATAGLFIIVPGINLNLNYSNDLNGRNNFGISPQIGGDFFLGSLYFGPNFNVLNQIGYNRTTFILSLSLNWWAIAQMWGDDGGVNLKHRR